VKELSVVIILPINQEFFDDEDILLDDEER